MQFTKNQIIFLIIAGVIGVILLVVIFGLRQTRKHTELVVWGVEDARVSQNITGQFQALHPELAVSYKKFDEDTYERDLLNNLAAGNRPDVIFLENNWLLTHGDKLLPAVYETEEETVTKFTPDQVQSLFPKVVEQDFIAGGKVYALPLYIDTLAMAYNRDLFDKAGIVFPATTWEKLGDTVSVLKIMNGANVQRGAYALGGSSKSVGNAGDIVQALLLQGGVEMVNEKHTSALF